MTTATGAITTDPPIGTVGKNYGFSVGERTSGSTSVDSSQDKDMFLKLLVAQMRYQDPSKPADATAFLSQTAQFTLVEKMGELEKSQAAVAASNGIQAASALVGRTVTYNTTATDGSKVTRTGVVTGFNVKANVATLTIGTDDVGLDSITKVAVTPTPA